VNVTVTAVNDAPVLASIGTKSVNEGALLSFTVSATDPDNRTLTYTTSTPPPADATFDAATNTFLVDDFAMMHVDARQIAHGRTARRNCSPPARVLTHSSTKARTKVCRADHFRLPGPFPPVMATSTSS
jgi:hypothetical protein